MHYGIIEYRHNMGKNIKFKILLLYGINGAE